MFGISFPELIVVGIVCLIAFGPDKLPELAKTLGQLSAQLRKASDTLRRDFYRELYPPLPENPLAQAKRELEAVKTDVKAVFTGAAYDDGAAERYANCETRARLEAEKQKIISNGPAVDSNGPVDNKENPVKS